MIIPDGRRGVIRKRREAGKPVAAAGHLQRNRSLASHLSAPMEMFARAQRSGAEIRTRACSMASHAHRGALKASRAAIINSERKWGSGRGYGMFVGTRSLRITAQRILKCTRLPLRSGL